MADAAIRAFGRVGVPIFDPKFRDILARERLDAAVAYLTRKHKLDADEAQATKVNLELALVGVTGG